MNITRPFGKNSKLHQIENELTPSYKNRARVRSDTRGGEWSRRNDPTSLKAAPEASLVRGVVVLLHHLQIFLSFVENGSRIHQKRTQHKRGEDYRRRPKTKQERKITQLETPFRNLICLERLDRWNELETNEALAKTGQASAVGVMQSVSLISFIALSVQVPS